MPDVKTVLAVIGGAWLCVVATLALSVSIYAYRARRRAVPYADEMQEGGR